ncbi:hypothetical protein [Streptomyces sp. CA-251251]|uniref:hypothetical protein n=1 Tax=Streptomyces sp. CA-251251 TaxID=3240063 RepID=UPI003D8B5C7E
MKAVTDGLRSLDYVVEWAGRPIDPTKDLYANLLVYRMEAGKTPPCRPGDAWAHIPAPRTYRWPEKAPLNLLEGWLQQTEAARNGARLIVRDIATALWPPEADCCGLVRCWPAQSSAEAVNGGLREMAMTMRDTGYRLRTQERALPDAVETVDLLVYREANADV